MTDTQQLTTRDFCHISIFIAIISVLGQISIPMPYGVPITLQTFAIPLTGMILGTKKGTIATLVYVIIGTLGLPVFAGFTGGFGVTFGPTGGFILSFPFLAMSAGVGSKKNKVWLSIWLVIGSAINYLCGMLMFSFVTSSDLAFSFAACVLPFIPTAILKIIMIELFGVKLKDATLKARVFI